LNRGISIFGQRSITTASPAARARSAAGSLTTPSCVHTAFARAAIASSITGPAASELRNTSTRSISSAISESDARTRSPRIISPAQTGFTGITR